MSVLVTEQIIVDVLSIAENNASHFDYADSVTFSDNFNALLGTLNGSSCWALEVCNHEMYHSQLSHGVNPWLLVEKINAALPRSNKLLRFNGQFLFGGRQYADDVVHKFVTMAVDIGIDIFSVVDPLNDLHNLRTSIQSIKAHDKHAQVEILYTKKPIAYYEDLMRQLEYLNVDSVCIVNNGQQLLPYQAFELIHALKQNSAFSVHLSAGSVDVAPMCAIKAVEAGVDGIVTQQLAAVNYQHGVSIVSLLDVFQGSNREPYVSREVCEQLFQRVQYINFQHSALSVPEGSFLGGLGVDETVLIKQLISQHNKTNSVYLSSKHIVDEVLLIQQELGVIPLISPVSLVVIEQAFHHLVNKERYVSVKPSFSRLCEGGYGLISSASDVFDRKGMKDINVETHRAADIIEDEYVSLVQGLNVLLSQGVVLDKFLDFQDHPEFDGYVLNFAFQREGELKKHVERKHRPHVLDNFSTAHLEAEHEESSKHANEKTLTLDASLETHSDRGFDEVLPSNIEIEVMSARGGGAIFQSDVDSHKGGLKNLGKNDNESASAQLYGFSSPLTGTVLKIYISEKERFKKGDALLLMDVMKMQVEIFAESGGVMSKHYVHEKQRVHLNHVLFSMERT